MWALSGLVLSCLLAALAWLRSRAVRPTYYEAEVYGMSQSAHRRYATGFGALAALFAAVFLWARGGETVTSLTYVLLGALILWGILYGATFVRGAAGEDE